MANRIESLKLGNNNEEEVSTKIAKVEEECVSTKNNYKTLYNNKTTLFTSFNRYLS